MSYVMNGSGALASWIVRETSVSLPLAHGARGRDARRVQEWLGLHGLRVAVDGDFGKVTEATIARFQEQHGLPRDGIVDDQTWAMLTQPMRRALAPVPAGTRRGLHAAVLACARQHLREHPREIGGQNSGPWVRLYMKGNEGPSWPWCAGFVSFVLHQAAESLGLPLPFPGSFSCDSLAAQAKTSRLFLPGAALTSGGQATQERPAPAAIFLVRRTSTDWTHTGFVTGFEGSSFSTIEGNTNDDGSREGYEVCSLTRGYAKKDFIALDGARES